MTREQIFDAAFAVLPGWVPFVRLASYSLQTLFFSLGASWLALRFIPKFPGDGAHWTERARTLATATRTLLAAFVFGGVTAAGITGALTANPPPFRAATLVPIGIVIAYAVLFRAAWRVRGPYLRGAPAKTRWRNLACSVLLLFPHIVILVLAVVLVPRSGLGAMLASIVVTILFLLFGLGVGYFLGSPLGLVRPATERLGRLVDVAAARTGHRPREVTISRSSVANALALPFLQRVVVTEGALQLLDDEEVTTILAHEFGHLTESIAVRLSRLGAVLCLVPIALWRPLFHQWGWTGFGVAYVALVVVLLLIARLSRRMERRADAIASEHAEDPARYARALETIYRASLIPAVVSGRAQTHPNLYDRMESAGVTPDYPRPAPPSRKRSRILIAILIVLNLGVWVGVYVGRAAVIPRTETGVLWGTALLGADAWDFAALARARLDAGDGAAGLALARAAVAKRGNRIGYRFLLIEALAAAGRTEDAARALQQIDDWIGRVYPDDTAAETREWLRAFIDPRQ